MHIWEFEIEIFINIMMKQYTNVTEVTVLQILFKIF